GIELRAARGRAGAVEEIRAGWLTAAVLVPAGLTARLAGAPEGGVEIAILADRSNPIAAGMVEGALSGAAVRLLLERAAGPGAAPAGPPLAISVEDVLGGPRKRPSVAFFAAGIGVMFLLFATTGRGVLLIEERESGVLTRMLTTGLGLGRLLAGRWLYLASLGFAQVTAMFVWGALVFGLDLWTPRHLAGFVVMTATTAAAAAALAVLLAVVCRTRAQLNGVSVVLVLVMSALGGSLFPRFLMPETLRTLGLATFNAWALDGYRKVFWYESPLGDLAPQLAVLTALTGVFLAASRVLAGRWTRGAGA
ncbi:MAG: ABC transporter permease, partial [Thermoanaerobaculia bacterium]|nr:ABC transporter permease [Thermoanaerobaculia bacterium]